MVVLMMRRMTSLVIKRMIFQTKMNLALTIKKARTKKRIWEVNVDETTK